MEEAIKKLLVVVALLADDDEAVKILAETPDELKPGTFKGARTRWHLINVLNSMNDDGISYDIIIQAAAQALKEAGK